MTVCDPLAAAAAASALLDLAPKALLVCTIHNLFLFPPRTSKPYTFAPSAPEPLFPSVHYGFFVFPRLPLPSPDFPEVIVIVDESDLLVSDGVFSNKKKDPTKAVMLESMVTLSE